MVKNGLKLLRNITISAVVLLLLMVGGGVAYTWYMGDQSPEPAAASAQTTSKRSTPSRPKVSQTGMIGASVQSMTSPVVPGSNSSMLVKTNPEALCTITVVYGTVASKDSGLVEKKADEYGVVEWTWTVEESAPLGTWPIRVICKNQKNSAMVQNDLKIVKTLDETN